MIAPTFAIPDYDLGLLLNGDLRGLLAGVEVERLRLSSDTRIPSGSRGYITQLVSDHSTRKVQLDAARQLARYIAFTIDPEKVED